MIPSSVVIRGAGDLATGIAHRLWFSGFAVIMLDLPRPLVVRRTVSFATAVYEGSIEVESVEAKLCDDPERAGEYLENRVIPVLVDPEAESLALLQPSIIIDAIMAKNNKVTKITDAELVIGIGPGFTAERDVHCVVETKRGHNLGKVYYRGAAAEDTSEPGMIGGYGRERILRAPSGGTFMARKEIGDIVRAGDVIAVIGQTEIRTEIDGLVRGMLYSGLEVTTGMKIGDVDPRGKSVNYNSISDKARAVGGGVLEAILHHYCFKSSL